MDKSRKKLEDFIQDSGFINKWIIKGYLFFNKEGENVKKNSLGYIPLSYVGGAMLQSDQKNFEIATGIKTKDLTRINSIINIPSSYLYALTSNGAGFLIEMASEYSGASLKTIGLVFTGTSVLINFGRLYYNEKKNIQSPEFSMKSAFINSTSILKKINTYITNNFVPHYEQINPEFINNLDYMKSYDKKHDNISFL